MCAANENVRVAADELPQLDVTSVDLSFAEEESAAAPPNVSQPDAPDNMQMQPQVLPPVIYEPPPLTMKTKDEVVVVKSVEDVRATEIRPQEPDAPEMPSPVTRQSASQSTPAPRQARVDAPPAPVRTIKPKYPDGARRRGEQGCVTLELDVDEHGVAVDVNVVGGCGFVELEQAAVAAVRKAMFRPAKRNKKPVPSRVRLTLEFRLKDR